MPGTGSGTAFTLMGKGNKDAEKKRDNLHDNAPAAMEIDFSHSLGFQKMSVNSSNSYTSLRI